MAQNYIHNGDRFEATLGSGETTVKAGDGRLIGTMFGVVLSLTRAGQTVFKNQASAEGDIAVCAMEGVFTVSKLAPLVINLGDKLYWDNTAKVLNKTNTNTFVGYAWQAALSADTTVQIKLQTA